MASPDMAATASEPDNWDDSARKVAVIWVVFSILLLFAPAVLLTSLEYRHAWVTAHFATIARAFSEAGIFALGGVPVQNNLPLTAWPDLYVNWPPLYGYLLSFTIDLFGDGVRVIHLFATTITLAVAGVLYALCRQRFDRTASLIGVGVFLNAPIIASFGHLASQLTMCVLFSLGSIYFFAAATGTKWKSGSGAAMASIVLMYLAVLSSWEATLAAPGIFLFSVAARDPRAIRLSLMLGVTTLLAVVSVGLVYFLHEPAFFDDLVTRAKLRAGFAVDYDLTVSNNPHLAQEAAEASIRFSSPHVAAIQAVFYRFELLGPIGILALLSVVATRSKWPDSGNAHPIYLAVGGMFALWLILMPHHMAIHDYELLLLVPIVAPAASLLYRAMPEGQFRAVLILALAATSYYYRIDDTRAVLDGRSDAEEIAFMTQLSETLPANAIVLSPSRNMVNVFYSKRHVIRYVVGDAEAEAIASNAGDELCEDCPLYLVVPNRMADAFVDSLAKYPVELSTGFGQLVRLSR